MSFVDIIIVNDKHKKNNDKISKRKKTFEEKEKEEKEHLINVQYEYHEYLGIVIKLHSFLSAMTRKLTWTGLPKQLELKLT